MRIYFQFLFYSIALFCISLTSLATSLIPLTVEQKIEDTDAVVMGSVVRSYYTRDRYENIITVVVLNVEKSVGLEFKQILSPRSFKFQYLGGHWNGLVQVISSSPRFKNGENVVVFLKNKNSLFWIHHLAAGKFTKIKKEGKTFLRSSVFSDKEGVGIISLGNLQNILKSSQFEGGLSDNPRENSFNTIKKKKNVKTENRDGFVNERKVASLSKKSSPLKKRYVFFLLVLFLMVTGFIVLFFLKNKGKS